MQMTKRNHSSAYRPNQSAGFSLVEILTVLALIAVLGGLIVGAFGGILGGGQEAAAQQFVNQSLEAPLLKYKIDLGSYPTTDQGLNALKSAPGDKAARWKGPYIDKSLEDPWGNPYQYRYPGTKNQGKYDLWSFGPDGVESADDIGNWDQ